MVSSFPAKPTVSEQHYHVRWGVGYSVGTSTRHSELGSLGKGCRARTAASLNTRISFPVCVRLLKGPVRVDSIYAADQKVLFEQGVLVAALCRTGPHFFEPQFVLRVRSKHSL